MGIIFKRLIIKRSQRKTDIAGKVEFRKGYDGLVVHIGLGIDLTSRIIGKMIGYAIMAT